MRSLGSRRVVHCLGSDFDLFWRNLINSNLNRNYLGRKQTVGKLRDFDGNKGS